MLEHKVVRNEAKQIRKGQTGKFIYSMTWGLNFIPKPNELKELKCSNQLKDKIRLAFYFFDCGERGDLLRWLESHGNLF